MASLKEALNDKDRERDLLGMACTLPGNSARYETIERIQAKDVQWRVDFMKWRCCNLSEVNGTRQDQQHWCLTLVLVGSRSVCVFIICHRVSHGQECESAIERHANTCLSYFLSTVLHPPHPSMSSLNEDMSGCRMNGYIYMLLTNFLTKVT